MTHTHANVVVRYFEAWNRQDALTLQDLLGDSGVYKDPLQPDGLDGRGLVEYATALWKAFPKLHFIYGEILVGDSNRAACEWSYNGVFEAPLNGFAPTGKMVTFHGIDVFEVRGSKLDLVWGHYDAQHFFQQLTTR